MTPSEAIRDALRSLPSLAVTSSGSPPKLEQIFFPESHSEALDPDVSLVIGNRGMGKTFWTLSLADDSLRTAIAERYLGSRRGRLDNLEVYIGFSDAEGSSAAVSRSDLGSISTKVPAEHIWRAVIIRKLAQFVSRTIPANFKQLVDWVRNSPNEQLSILREADQTLHSSGRRILFLFDQIDQIAEDWNRIQTLTQGLMKTALAMKSYRSIKTKTFIRPDQAENKELFRFPDASKITGSSRRLTWRSTDLFGLLFFEVHRVDQSSALKTICEQAGVNVIGRSVRSGLPERLLLDPSVQAVVFDEVAGKLMGRGSKRGRPFTWIPTHLADGRGEISPRTFLKVMKVAAEETSSNGEHAITFQGIQEGVREASSARLNELEEDYPWVSMALEPLRGLLVPCALEEIGERWLEAKTVDGITTKFSGASAPIDLVLANLISTDEEAEVLTKLLKEIAVFEERANGKINVPDIFRVKAGILRKGGITPQQRKRLY